MPATSPRFSITLDPHDYQTIKRLADLQGVPMSRIIREFIHEVGPVLSRLTDTLEIAKKAEKSATIKLRNSFDEAEKELKPLADMILNQFDLFTEEFSSIHETAKPDLKENYLNKKSSKKDRV